MEDSKLLLTVDEAAHRLGIGRSHAYIYLMRRELERLAPAPFSRVLSATETALAPVVDAAVGRRLTM